MRDKIRFTLSALTWAVVLLAAYTLAAQAQTSAGHDQRAAKKGGAVQPAGVSLSADGTGTAGHLSKWTGSTTLGDSAITESKAGQVGIGTSSPTSKLTVQGVIETTSGGFKFPDGTIQTTAASGGSVAVPLLLSGDTAGPILSATNLFGVGAEIEGGLGGSTGVVATGGLNLLNTGGTGITAAGGGALGSGSNGGIGLMATGGTSELQKGGIAIFAIRGQRKDANQAFNGLAGLFAGDVQITGNLSKGGGSFKIDHPLDPANKYLYHSFVESPDMMNIYNGNVKLDSNGEAVVELAEWFGALNRDFRYTLTAVGAPGPNLYVAEEVSNNHFRIAGGAPGAKVSWTVTGIRQDAWANAHRIAVEEDKSESERGHYLYPELFNQPEEKGIEWAHHPEVMQRMKQQGDQMKQRKQSINQ
ncbi:MAG TPA: hypothetical protein VGV87_08145 [Blastocatellia bacterium]|nr:hypothetical protein [Blastocatellia bacterium]